MKRKDEIDKILESIKELREHQKETDKLIKETEKQLKETDKQLKETDEQLKRTDEQLNRVDKQLEKLGLKIGELTDGWGKFVEGLVEPSISVLFKKFGLKVYKIFQRASASVNGKNMEIDILAIARDRKGKDVVLVTEVKSNLTQREIDKIIKTLQQFLEFFPEYKNNKIIGIAAGIRLQKGIGLYGEKRGIYVLAPSGEYMKILNSPGFRPKLWNRK